MKNLFLSISLLVVASQALAKEADFPSHCTQDETIFLSAKMKKSVDRDGGGYRLEDIGKVVSLCADKSRDPIGKLSYRFGAIGAVELEETATSTNMFNFSEFKPDDDIPVGYEAFFFDIGRFTYYVTVAFAMGQGISLNVFEGEKEVVDLFSGTDDGTDFVTPYMFVKTRISGNAVLRPSTPWHLLNN